MPIDPNTTNKTTLNARPELGRALQDSDVLAMHDGADLKKMLASRLKTYLTPALGLKYVSLVESPDGTRTAFTIPNTISPVGDWVPQFEGVNFLIGDFTWDVSTRTFTFAAAPAAGLRLTAFGVGI